MSQQILPFYLVCDESGSMSGAPADAINQSLPELHQAIGGHAVVADKTRFCMISFSDKAQVLLPLTDLSQLTSMPALAPNGGTNYGAAFDLLRTTIETDVASLKGQGHEVFRPTVFFFTDGQPGDSWVPAYQALTDPSFKPHPNILSFGFGPDADSSVIQQIATVKAFISNGQLGPAASLKEFASSLTKSIVRSGVSSAGSADPVLVMPDEIPGYTSLKAEQV